MDVDEALDDEEADAEHDWFVLLNEGWLIKIFNVDVEVADVVEGGE